MWPLDLPARDVLKIPGATETAWAVFDPIWYRAHYPEAASDDGTEVLRYYLETGQGKGHSPNRLFDEAWTRAAYPRIAAAVEAGHYTSAFDAYCRHGCLDRSPHWLFDELGYRRRYADLSNEVLEAANVANGYDHFLRHGGREDRVGHWLFEPAVYLANFDSADVAAIRGEGVFQHYLNRIESTEPELRTSIFFDPAWYLRRYPEVAAEIAAGRWRCALHHYLANDRPTEFDPLESFSESHYLDRDPGLKEVIAPGHFRNGYLHFLQFGARELRSPSPAIDLAWYAGQSAVRSDLEQGRAPHAFAHWLTVGKQSGIPAVAPETERITSAAARGLMDLQAAALLPVAGRFGYRFETAGEPLVSVVLAVRDRFAATMAAIASLRAEGTDDIELIIIDRGSDDETSWIGAYLPGAKVVRFDSDIGWARAADAGRQLATGRFVLFLSGDARIVRGSIGRACARLAADPGAGAVGGMIVQPTGVIAQAGGIVWNDGGTHNYQRNKSPLAADANFVRTVDFVSTVFMLVRADLLTRLDGFDHDCTDGYEGVDLCLRIAAAGSRVMYDPSVMVFLGTDMEGPGAGVRFRAKHAGILATRYAPGGDVQVFARHAGPAPRRILFIEDTVPLRRSGSGFVRSNDIVQVMVSLGFAVTVYPVTACVGDPARVFGDMPDTVEVMHGHDIGGLRAFFAARPDYYDMIWVARAHNLKLAAELLPDGRPIVLDTEAVAAMRDAERARIAGAPYDSDAGMRPLLDVAAICRRVVAVTAAEGDLLRACGVADVSVVGHMITLAPTPLVFGRRAGMLFVGAFHTMECPNLDSLIWFVDAVLPLIETELGWETRLTIAGYAAPGVDLSRFADHPRITVRGAVADLEPLYNGSRVFVAPTRFAAGAPYKVFEAASRGLPVVATELLRRQLGWTAGQEILAAGADDPAAFAAAVLELYRNESAWQTVREGALRRLELENGPAGFADAVAGVLALP